MRTLQLRMAPTLQSRPICCRLEFWRSLRSITFIDIGHLGCLLSSLLRNHCRQFEFPEWSILVVVSVFWLSSGHVHVLLDCTSFTTSSFLCGLLTLLLIPSIYPPINPPTHTSTHPSIL